ncbi:MAG: arginine--tRNA ligase, partial [Candidatus Woesearchaeota archaeon]
NFFINKKEFSKETFAEILEKKDSYGKKQKNNLTIVIDYSAPNIAKPFGIGHLRSTVIGAALYNIYRFLGYEVVGENYIGDYGTQFGAVITAYKKWGDEKKLEKNGVSYLLELYVRFNSEVKKNPELQEEAKTWFKKLEDNNEEAVKLWELFREISLQEFKKVYAFLDVSFDTYHGESFYNRMMEKTLEELKQKQLLVEDKGAMVVKLDEFNMPPSIMLKSDGASTYDLRDLTAAIYRIKTYKPEKILYVVGQEQKLHFSQIFKVLELLGYGVKCEHVPFGLIRFLEGKMSTRKGNIIFLEEVLNTAIGLALKKIQEKNPDLKEKQSTAEKVGIGAIKFFDLSNDRVKDVLFDWERMLDFEGDTGPYIHYTYARACNILAKTELRKVEHYDDFTKTLQFEIVKKLSLFEKVLDDTISSNKPHILTTYMIDLAQLFNEFYQKERVLGSAEEKERLLIVEATRQVLGNGMKLLGMKPVEEM